MKNLSNNKIIALLLGCLVLSGCSSAESSQVVFPQREAANVGHDINAIGQDLVLSLQLNGNEVCPVVKTGEGKDYLLALPENASATKDPLTVTFNNETYKDGEVITIYPIDVIAEPISCGGKDWKKVARLGYSLP